MPDSNCGSSHVINILDRNSEEEPGKFYKFVFVLSWVVIMLLDPFCLYLNSIDDRRMCIMQNTNLKYTFLVLRSVIDLFHIQILLKKANRLRFRKFLRNRLIRWPYTLFNVIPIPQIYITNSFPSVAVNNIILTLVCCQYISRVLQFYIIINAITGRSNRYLRLLLDFLPFITVSHLVGAMWYYLAIRIEMSCWRKAYPEASGDFACADHINKIKNITFLLSTPCPINPPNSAVLNLGIYVDVYESGMAMSYRIFPKKLFHCFWWGLRNLSSFGSNLLSSGRFISENIFGIFICTSGLMLFIIYLTNLSSNLRRYAQLPKQMSSKLKLKKKMQMHCCPCSKKKKKNTSIVIRKHLEQQVEENKDVDMDNILSILPSSDKRLIMRPLCLDLLKRVTLLKHVDKEVLKAISEHMKSVMYTADCYIIREGEPLGKMFFIRQGTAWSYTTRSNSFVGDGIINCLDKDCFYGEELFEWAFRFGSFSNLPVSTRTVMSQEKVEVFVISAKDLKKIVSILWWHFTKNLQIHDIEESLLWQLKNLAMSSLLRRRKKILIGKP